MEKCKDYPLSHNAYGCHCEQIRKQEEEAYHEFLANCRE